MFLQLDGTFWVQLVNFAIFFAILNAAFLRPAGEAIRKRRAYIDSVLNDDERYAREAKALRAEAETKRAEARREAADYFASARAEAGAEAAAIAAEHTAVAAELVAQARATIASETEVARSREPELADVLARKLLQRAVGVLAK
jgi:F0F1-type ATP synthase membrane subunit b/b'